MESPARGIVPEASFSGNARHETPRVFLVPEYWRSCLICRAITLDVPEPNDLAAFCDVIREFDELLESGCADRIVLDLSRRLMPLDPQHYAIVSMVGRAITRNILIALIIEREFMRQPLFDPDFAQPSLVAATIDEAVDRLGAMTIPEGVSPGLAMASGVMDIIRARRLSSHSGTTWGVLVSDETRAIQLPPNRDGSRG